MNVCDIMNRIRGKCTKCKRSQQWGPDNVEIIYYKKGIHLFEFGAVKCNYCGNKMNIGGVQVSPNPNEKWVDDNPPDQMDGETEGQWANRMYFDDEGNPK